MAAVRGDPAGHVADRPEAEHADRAAVGDPGVLDRLPRRRQDVGEVDEALVRRAVRHLDVRVVRLRHTQELRLAAGLVAVQLRVAEQHRAHPLLAHLRRLALRLEPLVAHEAMPAGDLERDHDAVPDGELGDLGADLLDDPHRLVAEHGAGLDERAEHLVQVQVGAAQAGRRDADDRVRRLLDHRIRDVLVVHVSLAVPGQCLHGSLACPRSVGATVRPSAA
jgi:hypothetical protein